MGQLACCERRGLDQLEISEAAENVKITNEELEPPFSNVGRPLDVHDSEGELGQAGAESLRRGAQGKSSEATAQNEQYVSSWDRGVQDALRVQEGTEARSSDTSPQDDQHMSSRGHGVQEALRVQYGPRDGDQDTSSKAAAQYEEVGTGSLTGFVQESLNESTEPKLEEVHTEVPGGEVQSLKESTDLKLEDVHTEALGGDVQATSLEAHSVQEDLQESVEPRPAQVDEDPRDGAQASPLEIATQHEPYVASWARGVQEGPDESTEPSDLEAELTDKLLPDALQKYVRPGDLPELADEPVVEELEVASQPAPAAASTSSVRGLEATDLPGTGLEDFEDWGVKPVMNAWEVDPQPISSDVQQQSGVQDPPAINETVETSSAAAPAIIGLQQRSRLQDSSAAHETANTFSAATPTPVGLPARSESAATMTSQEDSPSERILSLEEMRAELAANDLHDKLVGSGYLTDGNLKDISDEVMKAALSEDKLKIILERTEGSELKCSQLQELVFMLRLEAHKEKLMLERYAHLVDRPDFEVKVLHEYTKSSNMRSAIKKKLVTKLTGQGAISFSAAVSAGESGRQWEQSQLLLDEMLRGEHTPAW